MFTPSSAATSRTARTSYTRRLWLGTALSALSAFALQNSALASSWINPGSGPWITALNWDNHVPTEDDNVYITFGEAILGPGTLGHYKNLRIGGAAGAALTLNGGELESAFSFGPALSVIIGETSGHSGTATISSGTWTTVGDIHIGHLGKGDLILSGGTVNINASSGRLVCGCAARGG